MAKKQKKKKPTRELTHRQLSKWQQQKRRQRLVLITGITVIAAAIILLVVGWYLTQYQPLHETAIKVNNTEFDMKYFIDTLKLQSQGQTAEYISYIANSVIQGIEENELIRQAALKLGVIASDDEIKEKFKSYNFPNDAIHRNIVRTEILVDKLRTGYFESAVPTNAEQVHIMAMLLESESQVLEVRTRLENGESFTELAKEFTLESLTRVNNGDIDWHPKSILNAMFNTQVPVDYAFSAEVGALSQPLQDEEIIKDVGYWLIKVTERDEQTKDAHLYAILLGTEEEAEKVRGRLEGGEDFATVAKETSQWQGAESNEGDLGMVSQGQATPVLDKYIFDNGLELNTLSEPIRDDTTTTKDGYWLIKVLDRGDRQISDNDREILKTIALQNWVASLWNDTNNRIDNTFLSGEKFNWAIQQAQKGLK